MSSYDIIFAGGGTTACVTAGRLAAADPSLKILIIEAGGHTEGRPEYLQPGRWFNNIVNGLDAFSFYHAKPSEQLMGRSLMIPTGKALGGGSAINTSVYTRASASDYDDWETVYGNKGWGSADLIPLLKKAETYQSPIYNETHGTFGPIKVSVAKDITNIADDFLEVAEQYDNTRGVSDDIADFRTVSKYGRIARYIDIETGRRSDTAHAYIYNQRHNKNLTIWTKKQVVRITFDGDRATGVEYIDDEARHQNGAPTPSVVNAGRLVVVAGGTFGSVGILERSGIGSPEHLGRLGIPVIADLPGVGENYMDHNVLFLPYHVSNEGETLTSILWTSEGVLKPHAEQWSRDGTGLLAHNGMNAGIKLRPTEEELRSLSPEFDRRWEEYFKPAPDKPLVLMAPLAGYLGMNPNLAGLNCFSLGYFVPYPVASGKVHITSATNLDAPLDFETGFLEDSADLVVLRWAYKRSRELARRSKFYRGEVVAGHPIFPEGSQAAARPVTTDTTRVAVDAPDLVYTKEDDEAIDLHHRRWMESIFHPIGTCGMKPREQGGVVDSRLNVHGVRGLKVADLSILPSNVSANTYNTAIAVGEKAAVIIAQDLGIDGVSTN